MRVVRGFSLIELLVALAIVGILTAIAFPSYQQYVQRGHRAAAQQLLLHVANSEEQYLLDARAYTNSLTTLGVTVPQDVSSFYNVTIATTATPPGYTITATPTTGSGLSTLTLDNLGNKSPASEW